MKCKLYDKVLKKSLTPYFVSFFSFFHHVHIFMSARNRAALCVVVVFHDFVDEGETSGF